MAETWAHSWHATYPDGRRLDTLGADCGLFSIGSEKRLCCCWRCLHVVMTDAGSHLELVAWASHFWSSGSVIVIVNGADWLLLFVHWGPWVCFAGAPDHGLPHSSAALDNWI